MKIRSVYYLLSFSLCLAPSLYTMEPSSHEIKQPLSPESNNNALAHDTTVPQDDNNNNDQSVKLNGKIAHPQERTVDEKMVSQVIHEILQQRCVHDDQRAVKNEEVVNGSQELKRSNDKVNISTVYPLEEVIEKQLAIKLNAQQMVALAPSLVGRQDSPRNDLGKTLTTEQVRQLVIVKHHLDNQLNGGSSTTNNEQHTQKALSITPPCSPVLNKQEPHVAVQQTTLLK